MCVGKNEKMGNKEKWLRFPVFRRSEVDRPRIKVGLLATSYEYVQNKKQKNVEFSSTLVPLNLRVVNDRMVQSQPWD